MLLTLLYTLLLTCILIFLVALAAVGIKDPKARPGVLFIYTFMALFIIIYQLLTGG